MAEVPTARQLIRRVVSAMAEVDQGKRPWVAVSIIASWIALTLLHDACAVQYMRTAENVFDPNRTVLLPVALTLAEVTMCLTMLKFGCQYVSYLESLSLVIGSHLFGSFVKNIWLQAKEPEFGMVGTFLEPLVSLILIYICNGTYLNNVRSMSLVLVSVGLPFASISVGTLWSTNRTVIITLLCGIFLILRNICVVYWHEEKVNIVHRSAKVLTGIVLSTVIVTFGTVPFLFKELVVSLPFLLITCFLHVGATYIACALLLAKFSVPTFCILSACVQLIEGEMLISHSHQPTILMATGGLVLILLGLYFYTYDTVETGHSFLSHKIVSINEMFTRIQFLMFFASALGVLFYVLQPRVSSRDLHTLSFVGLDKVIRRLLSLDLPEGHEH